MIYMVLDRFGDSLKQTFRKIARMGVVDKEAVEIVVRDLQRALLQSDVARLYFSMENLVLRARSEFSGSAL